MWVGFGEQMLHRLDYCTTGVLLLGRNEQSSRRFMQDMEAHKVQKQYKVTPPSRHPL